MPQFALAYRGKQPLCLSAAGGKCLPEKRLLHHIYKVTIIVSIFYENVHLCVIDFSSIFPTEYRIKN